MGAINTTFNVSCDFSAENVLSGEFEFGEDAKYLTIDIEEKDKKTSIDLSKDDAIMLKQWLEATIVLMEG
jgi:hypothetical protein